MQAPKRQEPIFKDVNGTMSCYIRTSRAFPAWISLFWRFWILFLLFSLPSANAQTSPVNPSDQPGSTEAIKTVLQKALASEQSALEEMDNDLERWKALQQRVSEEIEAYGIQNTAHANLLLVSQTRVEDLETALNNNRLMQKSLQGRIEEFEKIGTIAADRMARLADRIAIAEKQKKELQREGLPDSEKLALREQVHLFLDLLIKNRNRANTF